jgi:hypothetical protein
MATAAQAADEPRVHTPVGTDIGYVTANNRRKVSLPTKRREWHWDHLAGCRPGNGLQRRR